MNPPLPERIHQIVDARNGIKASLLCATLATEYMALEQTEIRKTIMTMVGNGELYEIEYTIPSYQNESLILPKGSILRGTSEALWNK